MESGSVCWSLRIVLFCLELSPLMAAETVIHQCLVLSNGTPKGHREI